MKYPLNLVHLTPSEIKLGVQRRKGEVMNIRKNIDYSTMFDSMQVAMSADMSQMKLYYELGRLICQRTEKGAAVAAAEYLQQNYPGVSGLSPRNLRRMRNFYHMYAGTPELLNLAMQIGWTQNVVILEADLNTEGRRWYLCAVKQFGWSKAALQRNIEAAAHLEICLDECGGPCYTEIKHSKSECIQYDENTFSLPQECIQKPNGRVYHEGFGAEIWPGIRVPHRISSHQPRVYWLTCLSASLWKAVRVRHRLLRQEGSPATEQRLREIRPPNWHGSSQPTQHVPHLRRRFYRQDASADGLYQSSRRGSQSVVHRQFRYDLAGCAGRMSGTSTSYPVAISPLWRCLLNE